MIRYSKGIIYLKHCIISLDFFLHLLLENHTSLYWRDPKLYLLSKQLAVNKN